MIIIKMMLIINLYKSEVLSSHFTQLVILTKCGNGCEKNWFPLYS